MAFLLSLKGRRAELSRECSRQKYTAHADVLRQTRPWWFEEQKGGMARGWGVRKAGPCVWGRNERWTPLGLRTTQGPL